MVAQAVCSSTDLCHVTAHFAAFLAARLPISELKLHLIPPKAPIPPALDRPPAIPCHYSTLPLCVRVRNPTMGDLQPIVIDNGSGTIRAGYAGEDLPKCFFPSFVGRPKHLRVLAGGLEGDTFIGNKAQELRGLLKIRYPLEHGIVTDWEDMERIWQYIYTEELKTLSEEVCDV